MNTGRLKSRVVLQARAAGRGGLGQANGAWSAVATLWAEIKPVSSDEAVESGAERSSITHEVRIHYRDGVTARMRFMRGSRVFEMVAAPINEYEAKRYLLCKCSEVLGG